MSIKSRIGRMLAGWVMAMVVAIVTKLIKRALSAQQPQQQSPRQPFSSTKAKPKQVDPAAPRPYKTWTVTDTIYQGMNTDELVAAYGQPKTRAQETPTREVWMYASPANANDNGMEVIIESGLVADWTEAAVSLH